MQGQEKSSLKFNFHQAVQSTFFQFIVGLKKILRMSITNNLGWYQKSASILSCFLLLYDQTLKNGGQMTVVESEKPELTLNLKSDERLPNCFVYSAATYNLFSNKASLLVVKSDHTLKENTETVNI